MSVEDPQVRKARHFYFSPYAYNFNLNSMAALAAQQGICQCSDSNFCPQGATGPPGRPGDDGLAGLPGKPGSKGEPFVMRPDLITRPPEPCRKCPPGPRGLSGGDGPQGPRVRSFALLQTKRWARIFSKNYKNIELLIIALMPLTATS